MVDEYFLDTFQEQRAIDKIIEKWLIEWKLSMEGVWGND